MQFTRKQANPLFDEVRTLANALGLALIDFSVFKHRAGVSIRAVVYKPEGVSINDCSAMHHALLVPLELAYKGSPLSVQVSSPGIDRIIKDASELPFYQGRPIRCYRTDCNDWSAGILETAGETELTLSRPEGTVTIPYALIAKAKLDPSKET